MKKYDDDDVVTMYFVIRRNKSNPDSHGTIVGYSDNRALVESYMEFHNCKNFKLKTLHGKFDNICKILQENPHDEIVIYNITTRDPDNKFKAKLLSIPMTVNESSVVNGETLSLMATRVDYRALGASVDFLKDKYRKALNLLHVKDAISQSQQSEHPTKFISNIDLDELVVFFRTCPEDFG